jgi:hypothetical protein
MDLLEFLKVVEAYGVALAALVALTLT